MDLGRYRNLVPVGRGGMGVVFRAVSPEGGSVAIKLLCGPGSAGALARFERERRLLASFGEPEGFVSLLDAGTAREGPYLVMPFVGGGTLRARLEAGPLAVEAAVELVATLAAAAGRAHERGIVHRDLKPENVLFTADDRPLLADLGLAKHFSDEAPGASRSVSLSRAGEVRGTVGYMPPEQMADAKSVGPTGDVFALGAILYECVAGVPAFEGESFVEVARKVSDGAYEPLARVAPRTPPWIAAVVTRALERAPAARFRDGHDLARALAVGAPRAPSGGAALAVSVLALLPLAGLVAWRLWPGAGAPPPARPAPAWLPGKPPRGNAAAREALERGESLLAAGDAERGRAELDRAIDLDPRLERAWARRGMLRRDLQDLDGAIGDLDRAIALDARDPIALATRGVVRRGKADYKGAFEDLDRAIAIDPSQAGLWAHRGEAKRRLGDVDGAIQDYDRALELDPHESFALSMRGEARRKRGDLSNAIKDLSLAAELDPENASIWGILGEARGLQGDYAGADRDLSRALAITPGSPAALRSRAEARRLGGDRKGAIDDLEAFLAASPGHPQAAEVKAQLDSLRAER
jgi:tetratricopeptide (TPR) repeat protein